MIELNIIRDLVAIFGVIAGFSYYVLTVQNTNKARRIQTMMNIKTQIIDKQWTEDSMSILEMQWNDFKDFTEKYDSTVNVDNYLKRWRIWNTFDGIGYQLYQNLIDVEDVYHLIGGHAGLLPWIKFKPIILEQREYYNNPDWFIWWEYLADKMTELRVKRGLETYPTDPDGYIPPK